MSEDIGRLQLYLVQHKDRIGKLQGLNGELLAALIQMEHWASTFAKQLHTVDAKKIPLHRNIGKARAVIAKAKELEL